MSNKNGDIESKDSVDIISNLNQDISLKDARPKVRIQSIDFVKGLAMIFIIISAAKNATINTSIKIPTAIKKPFNFCIDNS